MTRTRACAAALLISGACIWGAEPPPAQAFNPVKPICSVTGFVSGLIGKACSVVQNGGRFLDAGKKLLTGHVGSAVKTALGEGSSTAGKIASTATTALALAAIGTWVFGGAKYVLHETASVLAQTTSPQLSSSWFSSTYWRVAGIAAVLTLPFLFAAAVQALVRSDITLLIRAALGYLPLAMLAVAVAAPLTMLLLAASDQLAAAVSSAAGNQSAHFLDRASGLIGALTAVSGSPFLAFFVGLFTVAGAVILWIELLMRSAAVYVIVLMLPLAFAAFVWPARRVWAVRAVELLVALILSKFAIVAVLSLGGAALSQSAFHSVSGMLAGVVLLVLAAFAPWALLRLLPLAEIASGAAGSLRGEARPALGAFPRSGAWAVEGHDWASRTAQMRRDAEDVHGGDAVRTALPEAAGLDGPDERSEQELPANQAIASQPGSGEPRVEGDAAQSPVPSKDDPSAPGAEAAREAAAQPSTPVSAESSFASTNSGLTNSGLRNSDSPQEWQAENQTQVITIDTKHPQVLRREDEPSDPGPEGELPPGDSPDLSPPAQDPEDGHL